MWKYLINHVFSEVFLALFWGISWLINNHYTITISCVKMTVIDFWVCSKAKIIFDWTEAAHARGKRLRRVRVFKIVQDEALKLLWLWCVMFMQFHD